ncbi:hypothetical protein C8Q77DRAFT_358283 [Trametes polyzona]|nr:hypothetical protein C8Q77DRAFT_358283 [Trametes polyzona]
MTRRGTGYRAVAQRRHSTTHGHAPGPRSLAVHLRVAIEGSTLAPERQEVDQRPSLSEPTSRMPTSSCICEPRSAYSQPPYGANADDVAHTSTA